MKIRIIELLKNIKKNIINFISIVIFIFLGVTLFQGLDFSGMAVKYSINETFKMTNAYDLKTSFNTLLDSDQIDSFKDIEGIDEVEGFFNVNDDFTYKGKSYSSSITSLSENIATCLVVDGKLPSTNNEIAIFQGCAKEIGLNIGDTITFTRDNLLSFLQNRCKNPVEFDPNRENDFNFINNTFTITATVMHCDYLNHDVSSHSIDIKTGVNTNATFFVNKTAFNPSIKGSFYNGIYFKCNELNQHKYFEDKYVDKTEQLRTKVTKYIEDNLPLKSNFDNISSNPTLVSEIKDFLHINNYIDDSVYDDTNALKAYILKMASTAAGVEKIFATKISSEHVGVLMGDILYNILSNEKYAIGGVFFVIAFLICYSVINRLVNNEVKLIGTKKALGFDKKRITLTYVGFTLIAVIIGLLLGNGASLLVETVIVPVVFKSSFTLLYYTKYFDFLLAAIICLIALIATTLITILSCHHIIKKKAITLLQGDIKNINKNDSLLDKSKLFNKLSLFYKTIIRNFRYEYKRVIATIIGISSCVALLMSAISLKLTVNDSFDREFNQYNIYDTIVYADTKNNNSLTNLQSYFEDNNYDYSPVYRDSVTYTIDNNPVITGYLYVYFDNDSFNSLVHLDESTHNPHFENKGFWLPESYQKHYKFANDASITISDFSGNSFTSKSEGYYKHYSYKGAIYVDYETFKSASNREVSPNAYLLNRNKETVQVFEEKMTKVDGFLYLYDSYGKLKQDMSVFDTVSTLLFSLYGFATFLLAIFVILNLFMANIREKKREITTMIINGYSRKTASKYIYLDNILLTFISLLVGGLIGIGLSYFSLVSLESVYLYFIHTVNVASILISMAITVLLIFVMTFISLKEIKKFKLKDLNDN